MSNQYAPGPQQMRISAGTAVKIGFFGALGAVLFSLIISAILGIVGLILAAVGVNLLGPLGLG